MTEQELIDSATDFDTALNAFNTLKKRGEVSFEAFEQLAYLSGDIDRFIDEIKK
jgi:hypothetical protein